MAGKSMAGKKTVTVPDDVETGAPEIPYAVKHARVILRLGVQRGWKPDETANLAPDVIAALYDELYPAPVPVTGTITYSTDLTTKPWFWTWNAYTAPINNPSAVMNLRIS